VLFDPAGLDRKELVRLARKRVPVQEFDRKRLSPAGFFVAVGDRDVRLPDGETVSNGEDFRNTFHLSRYASADLFVPCGGRPGAVNIGNWQKVLDERGKPKFRFIVEGANLFITEEARLRLEERGVVLFKDASTNKGGVTSSSFEVFASLAMTDAEYDQNLPAEGEADPAFRKAYVDSILRRIAANARAEFELLWKERAESGAPLAALSNGVSEKINRIADAVRESPLADDPDIGADPPGIRAAGTAGPARRGSPARPGTGVVPQGGDRREDGHRLRLRPGLRANEVDFADYVENLKRGE
jgi:glutamate dehydrogenase